MSKIRILLVSLVAILVFAGLASANSQEIVIAAYAGSVQASPLFLISSMMQRVVLARVYDQRQWALSNETPTSVGIALAKLNATYVSQLIRLARSTTITLQMISNYDTIRNLVRAVNPNAKFDVVLNAKEYNTSVALIDRMKSINDALHVDGFYFDFYHPGFKLYPQVIEDGIAFAHNHNEFVGGDIFGGTSIPPGTDFIVCCQSNFTTDTHRLAIFRATYPNIPIELHLGNNPQPTSESCRFINNYTTAQRISYVASLAVNQSVWGYAFGYPVFFPACPSNVSYDSRHDGLMLFKIGELIERFNS